MGKITGKEKKSRQTVSRREFIKTSATAGTATLVGVAALKRADAHTVPAGSQDAPGPQGSAQQRDLAGLEEMAEDQELAARQEMAVRAYFPIGNPGALPHAREAHEQTVPKVNRAAVLFAIGDTIIPSAPGDPGYRDLEWYGITDEVSRRLEELPDADLDFFDRSSVVMYEKPFTELPDNKRADYVGQILRPGSFKDEEQQKKLKEIYSHARELIFIVYYQNFPEDRWPRDANRVPLLRPGDQHQITNPNTPAILTGWDTTGYAGPLTWEEEERRRNFFKKVQWQE